MTAKLLLERIKTWLKGLSFRTGVVVLLLCIPFYILSFAQMLLPISVEAKGVLWFILFGMAKTCQYGGLTILGVEGIRRLKANFGKGKSINEQQTDNEKIIVADGGAADVECVGKTEDL